MAVYKVNGKSMTREEWDAYWASRQDELRERLADMFASGTPPCSRTDREFLEGHCNGNQFERQPYVGDMYLQQARAAGVDTKGKVYISGLARFPGDPEAWVSGRGDVQRLCEERGWGCEGAVRVAPRQVEVKSVALAEDIVQREVNQILQTVPAAERVHVDTEDLREQVIEKRKPHWSK